MEFYLVDDLECDLTVFHPYRTLTAICKPDPSSSGAASTGSTGAETETEEGEAIEEDSSRASADDGPRYWGTGEGQLELPEGGFQHAWYGMHGSTPIRQGSHPSLQGLSLTIHTDPTCVSYTHPTSLPLPQYT